MANRVRHVNHDGPVPFGIATIAAALGVAMHLSAEKLNGSDRRVQGQRAVVTAAA
jgi:hypothetical protein